MGYIEALTAAGAVVHESEFFGSYQGDVLAKVTYQGKTGILRFAYGSCGYCDSFQSTFDRYDRECREHRYMNAPASCEACSEAARKYDDELASFGRSYLDRGLETAEALIAEITPDLEWDGDARYMVAWLEAHREVV